MMEARLSCEGRLVLALPTRTNLDVHAPGKAAPVTQEIGVDTFRVVGYFNADVFGEQSHAEYTCTARRVEPKKYELIELKFRKDSLSLRP